MKKYIYFSLIAVFAMMIYGGSYFLNKSYSAVTGSLNFDSLEFQNLPVNPSTDGIDRELGVRVFSLRRSSDPVELISAFCGKAGKSIHKGGYTAVEVDSYFANSPNKEKIKKVIYLFNPVPAYNYEENDSRMSDTLDAFKNYFSFNYPAEYSNFVSINTLANSSSPVLDKHSSIVLIRNELKRIKKEEFIKYLKDNNLLDFVYNGTNERLDADSLTYDEIATGCQFALWYLNGGKDYFTYSIDYVSNKRVAGVTYILSQKNNDLPNVSVSNSNNDLSITDVTYSDGKIEVTITKNNPNLNFNNVTKKFYFASNAVITNFVCNDVENGQVCIINDINEDTDGNLTYNGVAYSNIFLDATITGTSVKKAYVFKPTTNNRQIWIGSLQSDGVDTLKLYANVPGVDSVSVDFYKHDINDHNVSLSGANFEVYACLDGTACEHSEMITEYNTYNSAFKLYLVPGVYYVKETVTPTGYSIPTFEEVDHKTNSGPIIRTVSGEKFTISSDTSEVHFYNKKTRISITKKDDSNNNLSGAKFSIIDFHGNVYHSFTSGNGANVIEGVLDSGVYFLVETEAPSNYKLDNKVYRFVVGNKDDFMVDGKLPNLVDSKYTSRTVVDINDSSNMVIVNKKGIVFSKREASNPSEYIVGATITFRKKDGSDTKTYESNNSDTELTLSDGEWIMEETKTPNGYVTATPIEFRVLDGSVVNNTSLHMKDARLNVCFAKTTTNVSGNLEGAEIEIIDSNNVLVDKFTTTNEMYCINTNKTRMEKYKPGTYKMREVSAPKGFALNKEDITFEIKDVDTLQVFEMKNELIVPDTALNPSNIVYIAAIVFGILGIGFIMVYAKKYDF